MEKQKRRWVVLTQVDQPYGVGRMIINKEMWVMAADEDEALQRAEQILLESGRSGEATRAWLLETEQQAEEIESATKYLRTAAGTGFQIHSNLERIAELDHALIKSQQQQARTQQDLDAERQRLRQCQATLTKTQKRLTSALERAMTLKRDLDRAEQQHAVERMTDAVLEATAAKAFKRVAELQNDSKRLTKIIADIDPK